MVTYTTVAKVSEYLQTAITSGTTPSSTTVESWIDNVEDEIDKIAGTQFNSTSTSDVYMDIITGEREQWIPSQYRPLISVATVERNDGDEWTESMTSLVEGTDFLIQDLDTSKLWFKSTLPVGINRLKFGTISYGYSTVPGEVTSLATMMTSQKFVNSKVGNTAFKTTKRINVGPIGIASDVGFSVGFIKSMNSEVMDLKQVVKGGLKSFTY